MYSFAMYKFSHLAFDRIKI